MIKVTRTIVVTTSLLMVTGAAAQIEYGPVTGDAENGKQLYYDHACYACHAYAGTGRKRMIGSPSGVFGVEPREVTYISNNSSGVMVNEQVFITFLRARSNMNPQFPIQSMPYYPASSLPDDDAKDIYAFIRTFVDEPPEVEDIPSLKAILEDAKSE